MSAEPEVQTEFGMFRTRCHYIDNAEIISLAVGDITHGIPRVRLQSGCTLSLFHSLDCDCGRQIASAMMGIQESGCGVLVYSPDQEGRAAGLTNKLAGIELEHRLGVDSFEAYRLLGLEKVDFRDYRAEVLVLKELGCARRLRFNGNADKRKALRDAGFVILKEEKK